MSQLVGQFGDGEGYEQFMGRWSRLVGATFLDWIAIPQGLNWLDVGCGNGAFTEELINRRAPASVVGIDPSPAQIDYARARLAGGPARFQLGDAQALPFADASFDGASMALVIAFVPDAAKAIAEMARVVRPGGWVSTYMWDVMEGGVPVSPIYRALKSLGGEPPLPINAAVSSREALYALWQNAGLSAIDARRIDITVEHASFDHFWQANAMPIGPQGKMLAEMPAALRDQLRERVREQLTPTADGRIVYPAFANAMTGRVPG